MSKDESSDIVVARIEARLNAQIQTCEDAIKLLETIKTLDSDVSKPVKDALINLATVITISNFKLRQGEIAKKVFSNEKGTQGGWVND